MKRLILAAATALCLVPTAHAANGIPDEVAIELYRAYATCQDVIREVSDPANSRFAPDDVDYRKFISDIRDRRSHYWYRIPKDLQDIEIPNTATDRLVYGAKHPEIVFLDAYNGLPSAVEFLQGSFARETAACHYLTYQTELLE